MLLDATGWTLIHFLWQGAIITLIFALADALSRRSSAAFRYGIAAFAMSTMLACSAGTFFWLVNSQPGAIQSFSVTVAESSAIFSPSRLMPAPPVASQGQYLPWLVYLWISGVAAMSLRLALQWVMLQRCRRQGIWIMDSVWQESVRTIAQRLELRRAVRLYQSAIADVPAVIGWLRPIVLLPASAVTQLSPSQIEALLAHELAHVRRHDYLINLLQSCMETMFFYHPGVWWIGRRMREERENCCDDLAVMACGDAILYARALADLEQLRSNLPALAMAANGGGGLLHRIQRIISPPQPARPVAPFGVTALALVAAATFVWAAPQESRSHAAVMQSPGQPILIAQAPAPPSRPQRSKPASPKPAAPNSRGNYIDELQRAGYSNISVDQMISMKIHGVTPEYIDEVKTLGWTVTPDQLVSFRIHGVNAETVKELRALGYSLTPDQAVAARIHGVSSAFANSWKQEGLTGIDFDHLVALKIHGADPAQLRELKTLGFPQLSVDDVVRLRVMGVTPDFIREVQARGFRNLKLEQIIQLKQLGILDSKESK